MQREIELTKTSGKFRDKNVMLLTKDESLAFDFKSEYDLSDTSVITLKNGEQNVQCKMSNPFEVPKEILFSGWLHIRIDLYLNGIRAKTWNLLPVRLIEADGEVTGDCYEGLLQSLEERVNVLERSLQDEIKEKEEILERFKEFEDNGINVQFTEEENNSNQGENENEKK